MRVDWFKRRITILFKTLIGFWHFKINFFYIGSIKCLLKQFWKLLKILCHDFSIDFGHIILKHLIFKEKIYFLSQNDNLLFELHLLLYQFRVDDILRLYGVLSSLNIARLIGKILAIDIYNEGNEVLDQINYKI